MKPMTLRNSLMGIFVIGSLWNAFFSSLQSAPSVRSLTSAAFSVAGSAIVTEAAAETPASEEDNLPFALQLYSKLRSRQGNLSLSPFSIEEALAVVLAGARGSTADQLASALVLPGSDKTGRIGALERALSEASSGDRFQYTLANALWGEKTYHFEKAFLERARTNFGVDVRSADFRSAAEAARKEINSWVEEKTRGKIKDLITPAALTAATRLVIVNAIYFKAKWQTEFEAQQTHGAQFHLGKGEPMMVSMMAQQRNFRFAENDTMKLLEMPYLGGNVSMVFLLPKANDGLAAVEQQLDAQKLRELLAGASMQEVSVRLPKFKSRSELELNRVLGAMGVVDAFQYGKADFSGMDGSHELFISNVIHQAVVEVDEKGTEAAAATAVMMKAGSAYMPKKVVEFHADHPFLFFIREKSTGGILFFGRVAEPERRGNG